MSIENKYEQYSIIEIPYLIAYRNSTIGVTRTVEFINEEGIKTNNSEILEQATETEHVWTYRFMELGTYKFTIQVGANIMNAATSNIYTITEKSNAIPTVSTGGL